MVRRCKGGAEASLPHVVPLSNDSPPLASPISRRRRSSLYPPWRQLGVAPAAAPPAVVSTLLPASLATPTWSRCAVSPVRAEWLAVTLPSARATGKPVREGTTFAAVTAPPNSDPGDCEAFPSCSCGDCWARGVQRLASDGVRGGDDATSILSKRGVPLKRLTASSGVSRGCCPTFSVGGDRFELVVDRCLRPAG